MSSTTNVTGRVLTQAGDIRHLLRRLAFAATPEMVQALRGLSASAAFDSLLRPAKAAPPPEPPASVRGVWTNTALRFPETTSQQYQALRRAQSEANQRDIEALRQWWLREMIAGAAPLRENLTLFFHGTLGSSSGSVDMPHALHGTNALLRRSCLTTIPALLEELVTDPGAMIQIGVDEYRREKLAETPPNLRPAKLMLDNWTVGAGEYSDADVVNLARALVGWVLVAPPGHEPEKPVDPTAFRSARRTGLIPVLEREHVADGPKTILGTTERFDARSAVRLLARHPATARRYSRRLIEYFGAADTNRALEQTLAETYRRTDGSVEALMRDLVTSEQFWSADSRWTLIKSPVQLAVGTCRQLDILDPPLATISRWLTAAGQKLFDTPNFGDAGWAGQKAWVTPPDRLAIRYQLGSVLAGRMPHLGISRMAAAAAGEPAQSRIVVGRPVAAAQTSALVTRLDPAPGIETSAVERHVAATSGSARTAEIVRYILSTPQSQLA